MPIIIIDKLIVPFNIPSMRPSSIYNHVCVTLLHYAIIIVSSDNNSNPYRWGATVTSLDDIMYNTRIIIVISRRRSAFVHTPPIVWRSIRLGQCSRFVHVLTIVVENEFIWTMLRARNSTLRQRVQVRLVQFGKRVLTAAALVVKSDGRTNRLENFGTRFFFY